VKTVIRCIPVTELEQKADALTRQHWNEVALNKSVPLDIDWPLYAAMEASGRIFVVAVFDGSDNLVGYSVNQLFNHPHYRTVKMCQNDALFLLPSVRGGHVGIQLMNFTRTEAKARGAKRLMWHAKKGTALDRLLDTSRDYIVQDIIYSTEL